MKSMIEIMMPGGIRHLLPATPALTRRMYDLVRDETERACAVQETQRAAALGMEALQDQYARQTARQSEKLQLKNAEAARKEQIAVRPPRPGDYKMTPRLGADGMIAYLGAGDLPPDDTPIVSLCSCDLCKSKRGEG